MSFEETIKTVDSIKFSVFSPSEIRKYSVAEITAPETYDEDGRLLTSNMYTYPTSGDTVADTNREHEYHITSVYDVNGNLTNYRVVEL